MGCRKRNLDFCYGNCRATGKCIFRDYFSSFAYRDAVGIAYIDGEEALLLKSSGEMKLRGDCPAAFRLDCLKMTQEHFRHFIPGVTDAILLKKLDASGKIHITCDKFYDDIFLRWEQNIGALELYEPEDGEQKAEQLSGKLVIDYRLNDLQDYLELRDTSLILNDPAGEKVLDLHLNGKWTRHHDKNKTVCRLNAGVLDAQRLHRALKGTRAVLAAERKKQKDPNAPSASSEKASGRIRSRKKKTEPFIWPFRENEPPAIDLAGLESSLDIDLKNCSYTDRINASFAGSFFVRNNTFQAKDIRADINGAKINFAAFADLGRKDGWILETDASLSG